jgi:hypothetical protein
LIRKIKVEENGWLWRRKKRDVKPLLKNEWLGRGGRLKNEWLQETPIVG